MIYHTSQTESYFLLVKQLDGKRILGKMLNLDSLDMIHSEAWTSRCLDPDEGFFRERGKMSKLYITVLRLFYILGKPVKEELGKK